MTETIHQVIKRLETDLGKKGLDVNTAFLLLEHVTQKSRASILADLREPLTEQQALQFEHLSAELLTGKPIQHIIGEEWFYGRPFTVSKDVLIPRPETEELVQGALHRATKLFGNGTIHVSDIGTGSGAIAVTFKLEYPNAQVTATDISGAALSIARRNAERNDANITFLQGDLAQPLQTEKWDIILSNPPYIGADEASSMSSTVLDYEPHGALFAEENGLVLYRKLAETLPEIMNKPALIGLEIGYLQGTAVQQLFQNAFPKSKIEVVQDLNGKDRMIFCEIQ
ncbi:peptide chain release factor N(5)-glutamine methyltransferase [Sporosarcina sp. BI001-red]|uniref:peptide chain release factor N(5)-glutamine methyltransferase n=1 Tax=Sporosarcina sp. BI001-red TaxID=2282866 RepID=UPI000E26DC5F|nr:peptide chain release factor N(5)-glutamine methyltransferase [Sporosarcina sp. BI001-red]REB05909.1 peptide chain release factor N(5)-glutamine methyltransferase [Sporosarcina sp. BI001-red]